MENWSNTKKGAFFAVVILGLIAILVLNGAKSKNAEDSNANKPVYWIANHDLAAKMMDEEENYLIVDARTAEEYMNGHLENAMNIPVENFNDQKMTEFPDLEQMIFVYAKNNKACKTVCESLAKAGYTQVYYIGSASSWKDRFVS